MSNHEAGYLLNDVLLVMEREGVFDYLGQDRVRKILVEIVKFASNEHDCNHGEILDQIGTRVGLCYGCLKAANEFRGDGLCRVCLGIDWDEMRPHEIEPPPPPDWSPGQ